MKQITKYFCNALAAAANTRIDFTNKFSEISINNAQSGKADISTVNKLFPEERSDRHKSNKNVLIAMKTVESEYSEGEKITAVSDMTAVFFLPAQLNTETGDLSFKKPAQPWFVREFLEPMEDAELSVGRIDDVDEFLSKNTDIYTEINSWDQYWKYALAMYEAVTKTNFSENHLQSSDIKFNGRLYIFENNSVSASKPISDLYTSIETASVDLPLYNNFISADAPVKRPLIHNSDIISMKRHCAQMGGEYSLSPSQREAVNHFNTLSVGEILAVSGPPGTGKTTLLQSIVADMVVSDALAHKDPPVIAAASTNNQAVKNIINSFGKIKAVRNDCLEMRWITSVNSFAVYFPSEAKTAESIKAGYQCMDSGKQFIKNIESAPNRERSAKLMLEKCTEYFGTKFTSVTECRKRLHSVLTSIDTYRNELLNDLEKVQKLCGSDAPSYLKDLNEKISQCTDKLTQCDLLQDELYRKHVQYSDRLEEWEKSYSSLSFLIRYFSFLPPCRHRIRSWLFTFRHPDEFTGEQITSLESVRHFYEDRISDCEKKNSENEENKKKISEEKSLYDGKLEVIDRIITSSLETVRKLNEKPFNIFDRKKDSHECEKLKLAVKHCETEKINSVLDMTARYTEFWLAVHYYECIWLESKIELTDKQIMSNIEDVLKKIYKRIALVSPCMVMTFYKLPSNFKSYITNEKKNSYLYNFADLLIVDEAGQITPETAAASFSLASKALVVGDDEQIPPVWGIFRALDIALAKKNNVIKTNEEFRLLEENGLNTSQSSVMRAASYSCPYDKYDHGLFLCEHRRCFDEIIGYCNDIVYDGRLCPLRGPGTKNSSENSLPVLGFHNIDTDKCEKLGTSRINKTEAFEIALWLNRNFDRLREMYPGEKEEEIIAVITPFKAQARLLDEKLRELGGKDLSAKISVGTVHTFQGAEKHIIIFSTAYGKDDNCFFIDNNKNLMNVAVSRAKDAFWVFGSIGCLSKKPADSAGGLMYKYISGNKIP